jgi:hypothetical protein
MLSSQIMAAAFAHMALPADPPGYSTRPNTLSGPVLVDASISAGQSLRGIVLSEMRCRHPLTDEQEDVLDLVMRAFALGINAEQIHTDGAGGAFTISATAAGADFRVAYRCDPANGKISKLTIYRPDGPMNFSLKNARISDSSSCPAPMETTEDDVARAHFESEAVPETNSLHRQTRHSWEGWTDGAGYIFADESIAPGQVRRRIARAGLRLAECQLSARQQARMLLVLEEFNNPAKTEKPRSTASDGEFWIFAKGSAKSDRVTYVCDPVTGVIDSIEVDSAAHDIKISLASLDPSRHQRPLFDR